MFVFNGLTMNLTKYYFQITDCKLINHCIVLIIYPIKSNFIILLQKSKKETVFPKGNIFQ